MDISNAKNQVIEAGRELSRTGLIARTWGNVSCRTDEAHFVITASGRNYMTLTPEEVIEVRMADLGYASQIQPSSEMKVHREIYRLKEDAGFVVHTHQNNASAVSAMGQKRIKLDKAYPGLGNFVLCAEYGLPGTKRLCRNTAAAVKETDGRAVIMSNHGAVCYGRSYDEAFEAAHVLEEACGRYLEDVGVLPWQPFRQEQEGSYTDAAKAAADWGALWNDSPVIIKFMEVRSVLKPYLDDFAQLVGTGLKISPYDDAAIQRAIAKGKPLMVKGKGALCPAAKQDDREALSTVIEKNCRAALAAIGCESISRWESLMMRRFYLKKYSVRMRG